MSSPMGTASARLAFRALRYGELTLHRIREDNLPEVRELFAAMPDAGYLLVVVGAVRAVRWR